MRLFLCKMSATISLCEGEVELFEERMNLFVLTSIQIIFYISILCPRIQMQFIPSLPK